MDPLLDLSRASRAEVIADLVRQREHLAVQEQELARLRAELATQRATIQQLSARVGMLLADDDPGAVTERIPTPCRGSNRSRAVRRHRPAPTPHSRAQGYGRRRLRSTAIQHHAVAQCPHCQRSLRGGTLRRRREVIEVIPARVA